MIDNDLTTLDVLSDPSKNLCNIYQEKDEDDNEDSHTNSLNENQYYTETEFVNFLDTGKYSNGANLTVISLNIASLFSKLSSLKRFINNLSISGNKPDLIIVVETHISELDSHGTNGETLKSIIPGYIFFHQGRRVRRGGGVGIFVSRDFKSEARVLGLTEKGTGSTDEQFENIAICIPNCIQINGNHSAKDLVIVAVYRQPNSENINYFLTYFKRLMQTVNKTKNELLISGDFNLDLLKFESHTPTSRYLDIMTDNGTLPRIVRPTRIKHQSATLIDHIFTRNNCNTLVSGIIDTELSSSSGYTDHKLTFTILRANVPRKVENSQVEISYFDLLGHKDRRQGLTTHDWSTTLAEQNPDKIYDNLITAYDHHYHINITRKVVSRNSKRFKREPWMTAEILADIRRRDRLVKLNHRRADYRKLRNEIVSKIRKAERTYLRQQVQASMGDIKRHWKLLNKAMNRTNNKEEVTTDFLYQGRWISDKVANANNINQYYADVGKNTNESVGNARLPFEHYLHKHTKRNEHSILFSDITSDDVVDVCKKMTPKSSIDSAGFKQSIVIEDSELLAHVITHLVNSSLKTGICPTNSKLAKVVPIYKKKGSKHLYDNYRPISLLSTFSKIVEKLIYNKIIDFLVRYNILFESQFGFRKGRSTCHATLDFVKTIEDALENGEIAVGIMCDLSKAFDTINHEILLKKMHHYGIRGVANDWLRSYLFDRQQFVELNGCTSSRLPILTGVPQGSILGPLLFIIYINDLPAASNLKTVMFADDSNLLIKGKNLNTLSTELNTELEGVSDFFKANKLKLNASKTKIVCFRKKSQHVDYNEADIYLDGTKLTFEEDATFLGIKIDCHLSWEKQCNHVANTISRNNGAINRVKKLLPPQSLKILYCSLILPHLQYGLAAWGGCLGKSKKRIIGIQNEP